MSSADVDPPGAPAEPSSSTGFVDSAERAAAAAPLPPVAAATADGLGGELSAGAPADASSSSRVAAVERQLKTLRGKADAAVAAWLASGGAASGRPAPSPFSLPVEGFRLGGSPVRVAVPPPPRRRSRS